MVYALFFSSLVGLTILTFIHCPECVCNKIRAFTFHISNKHVYPMSLNEWRHRIKYFENLPNENLVKTVTTQCIKIDGKRVTRTNMINGIRASVLAIGVRWNEKRRMFQSEKVFYWKCFISVGVCVCVWQWQCHGQTNKQTIADDMQLYVKNERNKNEMDGLEKITPEKVTPTIDIVSHPAFQWESGCVQYIHGGNNAIESKVGFVLVHSSQFNV